MRAHQNTHHSSRAMWLGRSAPCSSCPSSPWAPPHWHLTMSSCTDATCPAAAVGPRPPTPLSMVQEWWCTAGAMRTGLAAHARTHARSGPPTLRAPTLQQPAPDRHAALAFCCAPRGQEHLWPVVRRLQVRFGRLHLRGRSGRAPPSGAGTAAEPRRILADRCQHIAASRSRCWVHTPHRRVALLLLDQLLDRLRRGSLMILRLSPLGHPTLLRESLARCRCPSRAPVARALRSPVGQWAHVCKAAWLVCSTQRLCALLPRSTTKHGAQRPQRARPD